MPYIITTYDRHEVYGTPNAVVVKGRTAVATLDEVRERAHREFANAMSSRSAEKWTPYMDAIDALPEAGGTVGPLPDGTVIEVRPISLAEMVGSPVAEYNERHTAEIIAAFNAAA